MRFFQKYLFQILIILVNIPTRAQKFKIKRIFSSLNILLGKIKHVIFIFLYHRIGLHFPEATIVTITITITVTVTIINDRCSCFDGFWKVKFKYIGSCLNAFAKLQNARGSSRYPVLMRNCPKFSHRPWPYQSAERCAISPFQVVYRARDSVTTREVPLEKKFDMKYIQVKALRSIARMTKISGDIRTDQIDRPCPDALGM